MAADTTQAGVLRNGAALDRDWAQALPSGKAVLPSSSASCRGPLGPGGVTSDLHRSLRSSPSSQQRLCPCPPGSVCLRGEKRGEVVRLVP